MRRRAALAVRLAAVAAFTLASGVAAAQSTTGKKAAASQPVQAKKPLPSRPVTLPASRQPGRPGSFEVSASASWLGPGSAGTSAAVLTPSVQDGQGYTWFRAKGEYASSVGVRAAIGYNLTRTFAVEGAFVYSPSTVRFVVSDDPELTDGFTSPGQRLSEYFVEASIVAQLRPLSFARGRGRPFVSGGAGYLRQLHAEKSLVETGQIYHAGGGVKYMLAPRRRGMVRAFGLRIDGRLNIRSGGFSFTGASVLSPAVSAGIVAAF